MHDILRELSQKNLFYYKKMDSSNMNFDDDESLTDYIRENMKKPFFYMQHHFFTNFTKYIIIHIKQLIFHHSWSFFVQFRMFAMRKYYTRNLINLYSLKK